MSDEEDTMSDGFSASEDEWKPSKDIKGGESSDDDDSDFEESPLTGAASGCSGTSVGRKRGEPKARSAAKQTASKKRAGLSLRTKLYNKYRPPPKTLSPSNSFTGKNSPSTSTRMNSKNATAPNVSKSRKRKTDNTEDSGSSSDSSIENYLVNFEDINIESSFFNVQSKSINKSSASPVFFCNSGLKSLSDSGSNDVKDQTKKGETSYNFNNLLEYAKTMEHFKESVAKHNAEEANKKTALENIDNLDVYSVLALGEKHQNRSHNDGEDEDDEDDTGGIGNATQSGGNQPSKLSKTKSTRIKRHTKTRPSSTVTANDTDDSDWEEVADSTATSNNSLKSGNLEIHVELPSRNREKKTTTQQDIEMAFKRRLNRDMKERQVLLHKASLLCRFGRLFFYNNLLNSNVLMQKALKLLPSKSAYPPEKGTEIKYFQSMVTWFKSVIKLKSQNLYPEKSVGSKTEAIGALLNQIEDKEACSKQDMVFIFIILVRGMGLQCRLISNMQPLPLKPAQSDLLPIKLKTAENKKTNASAESNKKDESASDENVTATGEENSSTKKKNTKETKTRAAKNNSNNVPKSKEDSKTCPFSNNSKSNAKSTRSDKQMVHNKRTEKENPVSIDEENILNTGGNKENNIRQTRSTAKNSNAKSNKQEINIPVSKSAKLINPDNKTKPKETEAESNYSNPSSQTNIISLNIEKQNDDEKCEKMKKLQTKRTKSAEKQIAQPQVIALGEIENRTLKEQESSQNENKHETRVKLTLSRLKRTQPKESTEDLEATTNKKPNIEQGTVIPKVVIHSGSHKKNTELPSTSIQTRKSRSRSKSPQIHISTAFILQGNKYKEKLSGFKQQDTDAKTSHRKGLADNAKISTHFLQKTQNFTDKKSILRSRQKTNGAQSNESAGIPQQDGANDELVDNKKALKSKNTKRQVPNLKKLKVHSSEKSDEDFEPSPPKNPKVAPTLLNKDRRVVTSDDENDKIESTKRKPTAGDLWVEVWCDVEEQWVCVDIFKGKLHCVDTIRKSASAGLSYVFAFQNDLSIKDVTARYCPYWASVVRKSRVDSAWLNAAISKYLGHRTMRDIKEDEELRRIHEEKPIPTAISEYKNHPFYALERHLLKFEALYPRDAPALGYVRGQPVYSRDCVHTLHSREIWLKQARTVKLGEKPYKIVKARPKWDRTTQTVIKDQPLEIFGYWQTQDYEPPTAENGLVPRNAYGNVELFKACMLPKKTKHIRLPGLNRICKKLNIDCANAVVGFDFHQGACHPTYDGFIVCEEFEDQVVAAWHQDQEEQVRKEQEKFEARVYGNWKKLIRGLLIRERLKLKYNF